MGLKNLVIPSAQIQVPGNDPLVVRGLGPDALTYLFRLQPEALEAAYTLASGVSDADATGKIAIALMGQFPVLAAMVIACACDEPEEWQKTLRLPLSVQVEALETIFTLTFVGEGAVEKFMGTVISVMARTTGLLQQALPSSSQPTARR